MVVSVGRFDFINYDGGGLVGSIFSWIYVRITDQASGSAGFLQFTLQVTYRYNYNCNAYMWMAVHTPRKVPIE